MGRTKSRTRPLPVSSGSSIALIVANAVPFIGVLFFGWDLGEIMVLYWAESGIIAWYTALKIAIDGWLAAVFAVPFFVGHFGGFMAGHFQLIYALFLRETTAGWAPGAVAALRFIFVPIWISIAACRWARWSCCLSSRPQPTCTPIVTSTAWRLKR